MADNKRNIICPACGKKMKKVYVSEANVNVDICTEGCGGIYFDNRELEKFDEQNENADEIFAEIEDKNFEPVDENAIRNCPVCGIPMVKMGAGKGNVIINICNSCGGKFLDNKEIETIRNSSESKSTKAEILTETLIAKDYETITKKAYYSEIKDSPRRKAFENFVKNFL